MIGLITLVPELGKDIDGDNIKMIKWILLGILTLAPTPAISNEEISECVCKTDDLVIVEHVDEIGYDKLTKYDNDLICIIFESTRVDEKYRLDVATCSRDENT